MGYLDNSSGPILVPPIPDQSHSGRPFREIGVDWDDDVAPMSRTRRRYRVPTGLFYFLTDLDRYYEFSELDEIGSGVNTDIPIDAAFLEIQRRSLYWTMAFFVVAHELLNQIAVPPGYPVTISAGYFDPDREGDAFGMAISIDSEDIDIVEALPPEPIPLYSLPVIEHRLVRLPRIYGWPDPNGPLIVRRPREYVELHGPPGFGGASSASYVRDAATATPMGLLGCRHVLPTPTVGAGVPVAGYPSQTVTAISDALDLAVVSSPTRIPATPRPVHHWPAQWQPCQIDAISAQCQRELRTSRTAGGCFPIR